MKTETTVYRFKVRSPITTHLLGIGFSAGSQSFKTIEQAKDYRGKYPEFFVLSRPVQNDQIVLVKETTITEIIE